MILSEELDSELCRFVVSWHRKERALGDISVIDFDLSDQTDVLDIEILDSRLQYVDWSQRLQDKMLDAGLAETPEYRKLVGHGTSAARPLRRTSPPAPIR